MEHRCANTALLTYNGYCQIENTQVGKGTGGVSSVKKEGKRNNEKIWKNETKLS